MEKIYRQMPDVVTRKIAGEVFLVPVRGKLADLQQLFVLNRVGECVWEHLDGSRTREEMVTLIFDQFEVDEERAGADFDEFLARLREAGLVEVVA